MACSARLSAGAAGGWARRGWCRGGRSAVASVPLRRRAELGITPDVAIPGPRSGLHLRTADKRWFVAVRLRCRNGGAQAPINVISTPTCGVLIRILVCARGMSRKEAFASLFVTGLLLAGRARAKIASAGSRARTSLRREALNRARLRYRARAFSMVVRSASMTVPRNAPFSRTSRPRMVDPEGEHTSSFNWPGCLPDSSTSFAAPSTP